MVAVKKLGYLFGWLFVLIASGVAFAQPATDYSDPPPRSDGMGLVMLAVIVLLVLSAGAIIAGVIYLYKRSTRNRSIESSRSSQPQMQESKATSTPPPSADPRGSVFISYRRDDSADITGRIYDRLLQRFARDVVFKDVDSIPLGIDFRQHLESALSQCRVLIAVIGDEWIERCCERQTTDRRSP